MDFYPLPGLFEGKFSSVTWKINFSSIFLSFWSHFSYNSFKLSFFFNFSCPKSIFCQNSTLFKLPAKDNHKQFSKSSWISIKNSPQIPENFLLFRTQKRFFPAERVQYSCKKKNLKGKERKTDGFSRLKYIKILLVSITSKLLFFFLIFPTKLFNGKSMLEKHFPNLLPGWLHVCRGVA